MTPKAIWDVAGRGGFLPRAWATIDPQLQMILSRALHSDPARRTSTCGAFREELLGLAMAQKADAERTLRELMEHTFADDIARERALMARFASVSLASYQAALEDSRANMTLVASSSPPAPAAPEVQPASVVDSSTSPAAIVPNGVAAIAAASAARDGTQIVARPVRPVPVVVENSGVDAAAFGQSKRPWALLAVVALLVMLGVFMGRQRRAVEAMPTPAPIVVVAAPPVVPVVAVEPVVPVVAPLAPAVAPVAVPVVEAAVPVVAPSAPVSAPVVAKPTPAKPAAAPVVAPAVPQAPPAAPEPPVVAETPEPAKDTRVVEQALWRAFKAAHKEEPCVKALVLKGFKLSEPALLLDHSAAIRTCAASLGTSL
jgi:hypothetical protein